MKKFFALALALVLTCTLAVTCFAATTAGTGDVKATYVAGTTSAVVYDVDVSFGDMAFTYTAASQGTWDPDTHTYKNIADATWTVGENQNKITVTNHSNAAVAVTVSYAKATGFDGITGTVTNGSFNLATAVGTAKENAPTNTATLNLSGDLAAGTTAATVGTLTVTFE